MAESDVQEFRERFRLWIIERLVLKFAFGTPVLAGAMSIEESEDALKEWLDLNSARADETYGSHFGDPGLAALYGDEVKEVIDDMKTVVEGIAQEMKTSRDRRTQ